jgi:hypothetical protein
MWPVKLFMNNLCSILMSKTVWSLIFLLFIHGLPAFFFTERRIVTRTTALYAGCVWFEN